MFTCRLKTRITTCGASVRKMVIRCKMNTSVYNSMNQFYKILLSKISHRKIHSMWLNVYEMLNNKMFWFDYECPPILQYGKYLVSS